MNARDRRVIQQHKESIEHSKMNHEESIEVSKKNLKLTVFVIVLTIVSILVAIMGIQVNRRGFDDAPEQPQPTVTIQYNTGDAFFPLSRFSTVPIDSNGYIEFSHPWWEPEDKGLQFEGWVRDDNASHGIYPAGHHLRINVGVQADGSTLVFYARMMFMDLECIDSRGRVTIFYHYSGGYNPPSALGMVKNSVGAVQFQHPLDVPTRMGYRFVGWQLHGDADFEITVASQYVVIPIGNPTQNAFIMFIPKWERLY